MNGYDILLLGIIAACVVLAVRFQLRRRKKGGCSGQCGACPHSCKDAQTGEK